MIIPVIINLSSFVHVSKPCHLSKHIIAVSHSIRALKLFPAFQSAIDCNTHHQFNESFLIKAIYQMFLSIVSCTLILEILKWEKYIWIMLPDKIMGGNVIMDTTE